MYRRRFGTIDGNTGGTRVRGSTASTAAGTNHAAVYVFLLLVCVSGLVAYAASVRNKVVYLEDLASGVTETAKRDAVAVYFEGMTGDAGDTVEADADQIRGLLRSKVVASETPHLIVSELRISNLTIQAEDAEDAEDAEGDGDRLEQEAERTETETLGTLDTLDETRRLRFNCGVSISEGEVACLGLTCAEAKFRSLPPEADSREPFRMLVYSESRHKVWTLPFLHDPLLDESKLVRLSTTDGGGALLKSVKSAGNVTVEDKQGRVDEEGRFSEFASRHGVLRQKAFARVAARIGKPLGFESDDFQLLRFDAAAIFPSAVTGAGVGGVSKGATFVLTLDSAASGAIGGNDELVARWRTRTEFENALRGPFRATAATANGKNSKRLPIFNETDTSIRFLELQPQKSDAHGSVFVAASGSDCWAASTPQPFELADEAAAAAKTDRLLAVDDGLTMLGRIEAAFDLATGNAGDVLTLSADEATIELAPIAPARRSRGSRAEGDLVFLTVDGATGKMTETGLGAEVDPMKAARYLLTCRRTKLERIPTSLLRLGADAASAAGRSWVLCSRGLDALSALNLPWATKVSTSDSLAISNTAGKFAWTDFGDYVQRKVWINTTRLYGNRSSREDVRIACFDERTGEIKLHVRFFRSRPSAKHGPKFLFRLAMEAVADSSRDEHVLRFAPVVPKAGALDNFSFLSVDSKNETVKLRTDRSRQFRSGVNLAILKRSENGGDVTTVQFIKSNIEDHAFDSKYVLTWSTSRGLENLVSQTMNDIFNQSRELPLYRLGKRFDTSKKSAVINAKYYSGTYFENVITGSTGLHVLCHNSAAETKRLTFAELSSSGARSGAAGADRVVIFRDGEFFALPFVGSESKVGSGSKFDRDLGSYFEKLFPSDEAGSPLEKYDNGDKGGDDSLLLSLNAPNKSISSSALNLPGPPKGSHQRGLEILTVDPRKGGSMEWRPGNLYPYTEPSATHAAALINGTKIVWLPVQPVTTFFSSKEELPLSVSPVGVFGCNFYATRSTVLVIKVQMVVTAGGRGIAEGESDSQFEGEREGKSEIRSEEGENVGGSAGRRPACFVQLTLERNGRAAADVFAHPLYERRTRFLKKKLFSKNCDSGLNEVRLYLHTTGQKAAALATAALSYFSVKATAHAGI